MVISYKLFSLISIISLGGIYFIRKTHDHKTNIDVSFRKHPLLEQVKNFDFQNVDWESINKRRLLSDYGLESEITEKYTYNMFVPFYNLLKALYYNEITYVSGYFVYFLRKEPNTEMYYLEEFSHELKKIVIKDKFNRVKDVTFIKEGTAFYGYGALKRNPEDDFFGGHYILIDDSIFLNSLIFDKNLKDDSDASNINDVSDDSDDTALEELLKEIRTSFDEVVKSHCLDFDADKDDRYFPDTNYDFNIHLLSRLYIEIFLGDYFDELRLNHNNKYPEESPVSDSDDNLFKNKKLNELEMKILVYREFCYYLTIAETGCVNDEL